MALNAASALLILDDARREAEIASQNDADDWNARYLEGKADGVAHVLEAMGVPVPPWKPRPLNVKPSCDWCDNGM